MRWLLVSRQHHPTHGGIGTYAQRFLHAAHEAGWHVELLTKPGNDWPRCKRVHELRTPDMNSAFNTCLPELRRRHVVRPYRYALWSHAVAERLKSMPGDFDVIEFVDCQAEGFASIFSPQVRERHRRAKFIVHAHTPMFVEEKINGEDAGAFNRAMYHDWERRTLSAADGVIVTGNVLRHALSDVCQSMVIPYPIAAEWTLNQGSQPREQRILLIGSVQPRKGVDLWAQSLNRVLRAKPKATAALIGPDTPTAPDGLSMAAHVQRMLEPRVLDRFRWTGSLSHDHVHEMIARSSLVVVPSRLESFSFVAAEALLAGTPVLISDQTGIGEHVQSLPHVSADDVDSLAEAQIGMLSNVDEAMKVAEASRVEMIQACDPTRVLRMRQDFVNDLQSSVCWHYADEDVHDEMRSFISRVDDGLATIRPSFDAASSVRS